MERDKLSSAANSPRTGSPVSDTNPCSERTASFLPVGGQEGDPVGRGGIPVIIVHDHRKYELA